MIWIVPAIMWLAAVVFVLALCKTAARADQSISAGQAPEQTDARDAHTVSMYDDSGGRWEVPISSLGDQLIESFGTRIGTKVPDQALVRGDEPTGGNA